MLIVPLVVGGAMQENTYIVGSEETKECVIIDPGAEADLILEEVQNLGLTVKYILNTHGHGDHIGAVADLKEATGATYGIHEADVELLSRDRQWMTLMIPGSKEPPDPDIFVKDGDVFNLGDVELTAIETPGHTKGGVCYYGGGAVFTGDTLFQGSVGRFDTPEGDGRQARSGHLYQDNDAAGGHQGVSRPRTRHQRCEGEADQPVPVRRKYSLAACPSNL